MRYTKTLTILFAITSILVSACGDVKGSHPAPSPGEQTAYTEITHASTKNAEAFVVIDKKLFKVDSQDKIEQVKFTYNIDIAPEYNTVEGIEVINNKYIVVKVTSQAYLVEINTGKPYLLGSFESTDNTPNFAKSMSLQKAESIIYDGANSIYYFANIIDDTYKLAGESLIKADISNPEKIKFESISQQNEQIKEFTVDAKGNLFYLSSFKDNYDKLYFKVRKTNNSTETIKTLSVSDPFSFWRAFNGNVYFYNESSSDIKMIETYANNSISINSHVNSTHAVDTGIYSIMSHMNEKTVLFSGQDITEVSNDAYSPGENVNHFHKLNNLFYIEEQVSFEDGYLLHTLMENGSSFRSETYLCSFDHDCLVNDYLGNDKFFIKNMVNKNNKIYIHAQRKDDGVFIIAMYNVNKANLKVIKEDTKNVEFIKIVN
jgi:hypothetical protein